MYNAEQKQRYLDLCETKYSPTYVTNLMSAFIRVAPFEELFGRDCAEFSNREIGDFYSALCYSNEFVYKTLNSRLSGYTEWCNQQLLVPDGCNHYSEFTSKDFSMYINKVLESKRYIDEIEFYEVVERIVNPRDQFLMLCLFEFGKTSHYDEIMQMKLSDIDQKNLTISLCTGRVVKVSSKLVSVAVEADIELEYLLVVSGKKKRLGASEYIFKKATNANQYSNDPLHNNKIVAKILKQIADNYNLYKGINSTSIAVSGQIAMITRRAEKLGISKEQYVMNHFDELRAQYNMSPNIPYMYLQKYGAYL